MARTYRRDNRGRFSSTGRTGTGRQLAARMVSRGKNRLTRDNAGRITSVGGQGATARGGRLRTAAGNKRATQLAKLKGTGGKLRKPISSRPRVSRAEPLMTGGTLASRSSLKRARQKLQTNPTAAQRGAVTRANRYAAAARARDTTAKKIKRPASVMRKRSEGQATPPAFRSAKWAKSEWLKPAAAGGRGGGKVVGTKSTPTTGRGRRQAAAAQKDRNQRLFEFSRRAFGYDGSRSDRGLKVKKTTINQGNLFTGKTDRITVRARPTRTGSLIGKSAAFRKTQVRRARAEARYDSLLQQRKGVMSKGRVRAGELARINQRLSTVSGAFRTYDMGTGRRPPRRSTGRTRRP